MRRKGLQIRSLTHNRTRCAIQAGRTPEVDRLEWRLLNTQYCLRQGFASADVGECPEDPQSCQLLHPLLSRLFENVPE